MLNSCETKNNLVIRFPSTFREDELLLLFTKCRQKLKCFNDFFKLKVTSAFRKANGDGWSLTDLGLQMIFCLHLLTSIL